jgi:methionine sulfoxide reductase catalytic subunit
MANIRIPRGWELPDRLATPEALALGRRAVMAGVAGGLLIPRLAEAQGAVAGAMAAPRNPRYEPGRAITPERDVTTYNNYYEFGSDKSIYRAAQALPTRPWKVKVDGMVEAPREFDLDDLLKQVSLEERVYRHRCVEAWSMVVPWTGFQLSQLLALVKPLGSAKYVRFETAALRGVMPGLRQPWYPWPYIEGCTIEEAANELTFMVVGAYGKPLPPQNGAPLRVHFPWKYGFKSGKSLVRITLTDQRPKGMWEAIQSSEYGFWANVNPEVPHPRWSQASERVLGTGERVPTVIWNGYGEFVANMYAGLMRERLFV